MATLTQLQNKLYLKLSDQAARVLTSAQATELINEALDEWSAVTEEIVQENAIAVVSKQFDYPAPTTDIIKIINATFIQTGEFPLEVINQNELQDYGGYNLRYKSPVPMALVYEGNNAGYRIRLFPAPGSTSQATTLNGGINGSVTTIVLTSTSGMRTAGWVMIDSEKILYQDLDTTTNSLLLCRRGMAGTTAAAHLNLAAVTQMDLHYVYSKRATQLVSGSDVPEIDVRYHYLLADGALATALRLDNREDEAVVVERKWMSELMRAKAQIARVRKATPNNFLQGWY